MSKKVTEYLEEILELLKQKNSQPIMPPFQAPTSSNGEWCKACGAWKQYGISDNHHCTGYKVTC